MRNHSKYSTRGSGNAVPVDLRVALRAGLVSAMCQEVLAAAGVTPVRTGRHFQC